MDKNPSGMQKKRFFSCVQKYKKALKAVKLKSLIFLNFLKKKIKILREQMPECFQAKRLLRDSCQASSAV